MDAAVLLKWPTAFATPLGAALLLGLLGLLLNRRWIVCVALAWLWLWSTPWAAQRLALGLESQVPLLAPEQLPQADAAVLLGGGLGPRVPGWRPQMNIGDGGDRLLLTEALYRLGKVPVIVYSAGSFSGHRPVEADDGAELLRLWGVPEAALRLEPRSRTTRENARYSLPILRDLGARKVLLVSSQRHLPRVLVNFRAEAERQGLAIEFIPAACDPVELSESTVSGQRWLPNAEALNLSRGVFKEYLGLLHARLFGG